MKKYTLLLVLFCAPSFACRLVCGAGEDTVTLCEDSDKKETTYSLMNVDEPLAEGLNCKFPAENSLTFECRKKGTLAKANYSQNFDSRYFVISLNEKRYVFDQTNDKKCLVPK